MIREYCGEVLEDGRTDAQAETSTQDVAASTARLLKIVRGKTRAAHSS